MGKKSTLEEMKKKYEMMPTESKITEIDSVFYTVVSHYTGSKDIDVLSVRLPKSKPMKI